MTNNHFLWWQTGIIYQIYPRSFQDSNGDGVGDLAGITSRLDYLQQLGVDAIWLSPIFPSPMADFGYDVANYVDIDPLFGDLAAFDELLAATHARGMKLMLDLVPNHSSDEHAWFVEARASRANPKRDWYIWRDPAPDGGPPNNWLSYFGGPAWTFDEQTGQYYLHLFDPKQPDLNWRNADVRTAIYDSMRFWLDRGVDGFRVDVIWMLIKDDQFRDNPPNPDAGPDTGPWNRQLRIYSEDRPEVHAIIREMRAVVDEYHERLLIGEIYLPIPQLMPYYGHELDGVHFPFNFQLPLLPEWTANAVHRVVEEYEAHLPAGAWPNWVLGNHDQPRIASRVGLAQSRIAHMLLLTLRGTPTLYYGDEIGMTDIAVPENLVRDPQGIRSPGFGRDPVRAPMQWDDSLNAGFSDTAPWLPVGPDYRTRNVVAQRNDPTSKLALIRRLIEIRRAIPALTIGSHQTVTSDGKNIFAYLRAAEKQRILVVLNFSTERHALDLHLAGAQGQILCSTHMDRSGTIDLSHCELRPDEGLVIAVNTK